MPPRGHPLDRLASELAAHWHEFAHLLLSRRLSASLSATGRETLAAVGERLRELLHELLDPLEPHERGELLRLLGKLAQALRPQAREIALASE